MYSYCCVIPVYNNGERALDIIRRARQQVPDVLVIDDGSTDQDLTAIFSGTDIRVIRHEMNRGKGAALKTAIRDLAERDVDYMITLDADGHHFPEDIPRLFSCIQQNDYTIAIGSRDFIIPEDTPVRGRFGRKVANLFFRIETGLNLSDVKSGFRAYPVRYVSKLNVRSNRFGFDAEILVRAAWANLEIQNRRTRFMPSAGDTRFRKFNDKLLCAVVDLWMFLHCLLPYPKKALRPRPKFDLSMLRPKNFFAVITRVKASPGDLAAAAFAGAYCGVLPLFGLHTPVVLYFATAFRLNKIMAFMMQHPFTMIPLTPFLCVELGYFLRNGEWLTDFNLQTFGSEILYRFWEWLLGSLILAPAFGIISAVIVYFSALMLQKKARKKMRAEYREMKSKTMFLDIDFKKTFNVLSEKFHFDRRKK